MVAVLRAPRRLPRRFNRRIGRASLLVARRRHHRHARYFRERWLRLLDRTRRRVAVLRKAFVPFLVTLPIALPFLLIGILIFSPVLALREIRVVRTDARIDTETVQQALRPLFGRRLFFLSSQEVMELLRKAMPDLAEVTVTKQYPRTLSIRMTLEPLIARVLIVDPDASAPDSGTGGAPGNEYLTSRGLYAVYGPLQSESGASLPLLRIVDWGVRPTPLTRLLDAKMLTLLRDIPVRLSQEFGQIAVRQTVFLRAREVHVEVPPLSLWFDAQSPLEEQLEHYRMFLRSVGLKSAAQYIDLRLKDRVVYK